MNCCFSRSGAPAAALVAAMGTLATASGAITSYNGTSRTVTANMSGGPNDFHFAPDNGPWVGSATSLAPGPGMARLTSTQTSSLSTTAITGSGSISYSRLMQDTTTGVASSQMSVWFTIDEATSYALSGNMGSGNTGSIVLRAQPAGTVLQTGVILSGVTGVIEPGLYSLDGNITLNAPQLGPGSASWNMSFTIPSPSSAIGLVGAACVVLGRRRR